MRHGVFLHSGACFVWQAYLECGSLGSDAINFDVFARVACHVPGTGLSRATPGKRFGVSLERLLVPADEEVGNRELVNSNGRIPSVAAVARAGEESAVMPALEEQQQSEEAASAVGKAEGADCKADDDAKVQKAKSATVAAAKGKPAHAKRSDPRHT